MKTWASVVVANIQHSPALNQMNINTDTKSCLSQFLLPNTAHIDFKNYYKACQKKGKTSSEERKQGSELNSDMTDILIIRLEIKINNY